MKYNLIFYCKAITLTFIINLAASYINGVHSQNVVQNEPIYFFYPTFKSTGAFPAKGDGFSVQVNEAGNCTGIWGKVVNGSGKQLTAPLERPTANTEQYVLQTQTFTNAGATVPTSSWLVTTTQDLSSFKKDYQISFNYYYQGAYVINMANGRTPTDLEVYISTDYNGGDIQDEKGKWKNGTWKKVNAEMRCQKSLGVYQPTPSISTGAPWGDEFIGTPSFGINSGVKPAGTFYNKWIKCSYNISPKQVSKTFTVAFKLTSYFEGELLNNATAPGRGGTYFLSDFYYKAEKH